MALPSITYRQAATMDAGSLSAALATSPAGLPKKTADERRAEAGRNEIARSETTIRNVLLRQCRSPFLYLLLAAALIAFATGDLVNGIMISLFMIINTGLGFFQEFRAEHAARLLEKFWRETALAIRDGKIRRIDAKDLVPGDIIRLQAGDRIPADVRFLNGRNLAVDESVLTGESTSAAKDAGTAGSEPADWYQATNIGFAGSTMLTGEGEAAVFATGKRSTLGEISRLVTETRPASAFEREIGRFSGFIMRLVIVTLAIVFSLNIAFKGVDRIEELLIFAIALTVGVIPEALPVVTTVALSNGALRMAKRNVIVKRLSAINDLGSIDVLCTDKTGTITKNAMRVSDVRSDDAETCMRHALMGASESRENKKFIGNPFDRALWLHASAETRKAAKNANRLAELPFDPMRRRNSVLVETAAGRRVMITRGSPDEVFKLCRTLPDQLAMGRYLEKQGLSGNRVLAVAVKEIGPLSRFEPDEEQGMDLVGLISFADPLKPDAIAAAEKAKVLGVQIKILTGDSKEVAGAVAQKMGIIDDPYRVIGGAEFEALSPGEQHQALVTHHVFARVNPRQKFSILSLLKEKNTVGFLGEGFNDAPGLKLAHVAIAVEGASDIAKEAADVILLDKSLMVIFDGIEEGRRTFTNIIKYLKVTLSSNFGNFYAVAIASLFIDFLPMLPIQILFVNLLTDFPMITVAGDTVDITELKKPKKYEAKDIVLSATIFGIVSSIFDFITFAVFRGAGERPLQTLWFMVSVLTEIFLIYSIRTSKRFTKAQKPPNAIIALSAAAVLLAIGIPLSTAGREFFRFARPAPLQIGLALSIAVVYFFMNEMVKLWLLRTGRNGRR